MCILRPVSIITIFSHWTGARCTRCTLCIDSLYARYHSVPALQRWLNHSGILKQQHEVFRSGGLGDISITESLWRDKPIQRPKVLNNPSFPRDFCCFPHISLASWSHLPSTTTSLSKISSVAKYPLLEHQLPFSRLALARSIAARLPCHNFTPTVHNPLQQTRRSFPVHQTDK